MIENKKTVGSYINLRIRSPHNKTSTESEFFIQVSKHNTYIPENLYLVVGDPQLEIQAQVMSQISSQTLPVDSWKNVHSWLLDLILAGKERFGDIVTFIDCNPSFSAYTEISLLASTHLIVPCSSDGSSARAISNLGSLIYGFQLSENIKSVSFSKKAQDFGLSLPLIRSVLLNRSTQYDKTASQAFKAMFEEIKERADLLRKTHSQYFHTDFKYYDIPDAHSPAIVCSHLGKPISSLRPGKYRVHDTNPQVNSGPLNNYKTSIDNVVNDL